MGEAVTAQGTRPVPRVAAHAHRRGRPLPVLRLAGRPTAQRAEVPYDRRDRRSPWPVTETE